VLIASSRNSPSPGELVGIEPLSIVEFLTPLTDLTISDQVVDAGDAMCCSK
jgi:hypothetical protein